MVALAGLGLLVGVDSTSRYYGRRRHWVHGRLDRARDSPILWLCEAF